MLPLFEHITGGRIPTWLYDVILPGQTTYHRPTPPGVVPQDSHTLLLAGVGIFTLAIISVIVLWLRRNKQKRDG
ncbi:MAG: hypothetical protein TUN42_08315 [Dehalogenimonas sp.]